MACAAQYIPADKIPYISILSLGVPTLILVNLAFLVYWLLRRKRHLLLSLSVLALGYFLAGSFIGFEFNQEDSRAEDLKVMSFNVRYFNRAGKINRPDVFGETRKFIYQEDPDIICFQEVNYLRRAEYKDRYPYQHLRYIRNEKRVLLGIFSKFPIVEANTLDWPNTGNNGAYADILYKKDTIRVYNLHLESLQIDANKETIANEAKPRLLKKLSKIFKKQSLEAQWFVQHRDSVRYNSIVCGDFNNTQFSNAYRVAKGDMNDTFLEKGLGPVMASFRLKEE